MYKLIFALLFGCCCFKVCRSLDDDGPKSPCDISRALPAASVCQEALLDTLAVYSKRQIQRISTFSCCCRFGLDHCLSVAFYAGNCTGQEENVKTSVDNIRNVADDHFSKINRDDCPSREVLGDKNGLCRGLLGFFNFAIRQIKYDEDFRKPENLTDEEEDLLMGQPPRRSVFSLLEEYEPRELFDILKMMPTDGESWHPNVTGYFPLEETANETDSSSERGAKCLPLTNFPEFNSSNLRDSWEKILARYNEFVANSTRDFMKAFNETVAAQEAFAANSRGVFNENSNRDFPAFGLPSQPLIRGNDSLLEGNISTSNSSLAKASLDFPSQPLNFTNNLGMENVTKNKNLTDESIETSNGNNTTNTHLDDIPSNSSRSNFRLDGSRSLDEVDDVLWEISNRSANDSELEFEELDAVLNDTEVWVFVAEVVMALNATGRDSRCVVDPAVWNQVMARLNTTADSNLKRILSPFSNASQPVNRSHVSSFGRSLDDFEDLNSTSCSQANETLTNFVKHFANFTDFDLNSTAERRNETLDEPAKSRDGRSFLTDYNAYVKELERQYNESLANMTRFFDSFKLAPLSSFNVTSFNSNPFPGFQVQPFDTSLFPRFNFTLPDFGRFDAAQPLGVSMTSSNNSLNFTEQINGSATDLNGDKLRNPRNFFSDYDSYVKEMERRYNESLANMTRFFDSFKLAPLPSFNIKPFDTSLLSSFNTTPFQFPSFNVTAFNASAFPGFQIKPFDASMFPSFNFTPMNTNVFGSLSSIRDQDLSNDSLSFSERINGSVARDARSLDFSDFNAYMKSLEKQYNESLANMTRYFNSFTLPPLPSFNTSLFPSFNITPIQFPSFNTTPFNNFSFPSFNMTPFGNISFPSFNITPFNASAFPSFNWSPVNLDLTSRFDSDPIPTVAVDFNSSVNSTRFGGRSLDGDLKDANETACTEMEERLESYLQSFSKSNSSVSNNTENESFIFVSYVEDAEDNATDTTDESGEANRTVSDEESTINSTTFLYGKNASLSTNQSVSDINETITFDLDSSHTQNSSSTTVHSEDQVKRGRSLNLWETGSDINSTDNQNHTLVSKNATNLPNETWHVFHSFHVNGNDSTFEESSELPELTTLSASNNESSVAKLSPGRDARQFVPFSLPTLPTLLANTFGNTTSSSPNASTEKQWTPKNFNPKESDLLNALRDINASPTGSSLALSILIVNMFSLILIF